jgi:hypothetical protein
VELPRTPIISIRKRTTPEQAEAILAGNAARVYGFDLEKLSGGAAAVERTLWPSTPGARS